MNASEQARTPELAGKIAQITLLFKQEFADAKVDLSPWLHDPDTQNTVDPDSIDLSFNFPGRKPNCQSRSILAQIRFSDTLLIRTSQIIGLELSGHDHIGQQWRLSTVGKWRCEGKSLPTPYAQQCLKRFCQNVFYLFRDPSSVPNASMEPAEGKYDSSESAGDLRASSMPEPNLDLDLDPDRI
ncbi:MAG: hypothetical protein AAGD25_30385 [Cyanobacteria bacterium P01_F01_bin.150]